MSVFVIEIDQNLLNAAASEPNTVKLEVKMSDQEIEALLTSLKQETNNEDTNTELQWVLSYLDNPESVGEVKAIEEIQRVSDDMCVNGFPSKESAAVAPVMPPPAPVVAPRRPEMTIDRVVKTIHVRGSTFSIWVKKKAGRRLGAPCQTGSCPTPTLRATLSIHRGRS